MLIHSVAGSYRQQLEGTIGHDATEEMLKGDRAMRDAGIVKPLATASEDERARYEHLFTAFQHKGDPCCLPQPPVACYEDPSLLCHCPRCSSPLRLNPFLVDNERETEQ